MRIHPHEPPNKPWKPLIENDSRAILTFYYGDSNSSIVPIRDISHKYDPKVEPNYETSTYGLFSTCNPPARKSIAVNGIRYNLFCTRRKNARVLTGYYEYGWVFEYKKNDYMLAARKTRFISPGFPLDELVYYTKDISINRRFRCWKYLSSKTALKLIHLINSTPNSINDYINETKKQEKETVNNYGKIYHKRIKGYSWIDAETLLS